MWSTQTGASFFMAEIEYIFAMVFKTFHKYKSEE